MNIFCAAKVRQFYRRQGNDIRIYKNPISGLTGLRHYNMKSSI